MRIVAYYRIDNYLGGINITIIFDITSYGGAIQFITDFSDVDKKSIMGFIDANPTDCDVHHFMDTFNVEIDKLDVSNIEAIILHVTSNDDNCAAIKKYGLLNLQQALTVETPLRRYLIEFGIEFDISTKVMWCQGHRFDITYEVNSISNEKDQELLKDIARKIYFDPQIDGFFSVNDYSEYGGAVHERPELLFNLKEFFKAETLENTWKNNKEKKHFVVKYKALLSQIAWYSFYENETQYQADWVSKEYLKLDLIKKALYVVWNVHHYKQLPEIYTYMRTETIIPYSDILEITDYE
ncbi:hypothetical protein [Sporosarcina sp. FSL K6-3457]|uniref:hypothetical protein n=1 Tax=Sporosarcina sp. FSL K6-3457 TaxID=2978204 RepID=UPI0030F584C6